MTQGEFAELNGEEREVSMKRQELSIPEKVLVVLGVIGVVGFLQWLIEEVLK